MTTATRKLAAAAKAIRSEGIKARACTFDMVVNIHQPITLAKWNELQDTYGVCVMVPKCENQLP